MFISKSEYMVERELRRWLSWMDKVLIIQGWEAEFRFLALTSILGWCDGCL